MFVKTTVRRRGDKRYEYLSLVEAVREGGKVGHRTLLRLGEASALRESGQLDRIIAALRTHAEGTWLDASELGASGAPAVGAMAVAHAWWERLELDVHYAKWARILVRCRSRTRCSRWSRTGSSRRARSGI